MSSELSISGSLTFNKGLASIQASASAQADVSLYPYTRQVVGITQADSTLDLGDVATPGYLFLQNIAVAATAQAVTSITRASTTATVTTTAAHGLITGDIVTIAGAVETDYNGDFTITVTGDTTFTYTVGGSPSSPATGTITEKLADNYILAGADGSSYPIKIGPSKFALMQWNGAAIHVKSYSADCDLQYTLISG